MSTKGNEPAYPVEVSYNEQGQPVGLQTSNSSGFVTGLTKRERFAMAAMQGLLAATDKEQHWSKGYWESVAESAVEQADALITALNLSK